MGKLAQTSSKYIIYAKFEADGTVEKPDVIGAVFGQTEGLLGQEMDLRELQQTGRIGRIDVELRTEGGKTSGMIIIPSSLDSSETAMIAATIETIERVGPCKSKITIDRIDDVRIEKRSYVVSRAKELLGKMVHETGVPEAQEISEEIKSAVRSSEVVEYMGLPAGPDVETSEKIVIVEGRADVVNLLRAGIRNAIAIEGTSVPEVIKEISKERETTAFLDGDRGGDLILKELAAVANIDFVARAPEGMEVEELSKKEIFKALRDKVPLSDATGKKYDISKKQHQRQQEPQREEAYEERQRPKPKVEPEKLQKLKQILESLTGTRAAYFLDREGSPIGKVPVKEMFNAIRELDAEYMLLDGDIDQKLVGFCSKKGIKCLVGMRIKGRIKVPSNIEVLTMKDLS
ncbi:MAG: DNA primase DnaG [Candidatus Aenigmatarchaeota archaeon]